MSELVNVRVASTDSPTKISAEDLSELSVTGDAAASTLVTAKLAINIPTKATAITVFLASLSDRRPLIILFLLFAREHYTTQIG